MRSLVFVSFVCFVVSPLLADDVSDSVGQRRAARSAARSADKEKTRLDVPASIVEKLDYREWPVWHSTGHKGSPDSTVVMGRVVRFYLAPAVKGSKKPRHFASFVVVNQVGKETEIHSGVGVGNGVAGTEQWTLQVSSPAVEEHAAEKLADARRYLGELYRRVSGQRVTATRLPAVK